MLALSVLAPACLAAAHAVDSADAAHDAGVARVLGLRAGPWRALDVATGTLLAPLPIGTLATRAALGGSLAVGAAGAVTYALAARLLGACAPTRSLGPCVAAIASASALLAPPWQVESGSVGGSVTGALLVLLPLGVLVRAAATGSERAWSALPLVLGAAIGHEPLVGACAVAGCAAFVATSATARRGFAEAATDPRRAAWLLAGLLPLAVAMARARATGDPLSTALGFAWAGESGGPAVASAAGFVGAEVGTLVGALGLLGTGLAAFVAPARPLACALATLAATGLACGRLGSPVGPTRYGAPVLASFASGCVLAGVAMQAIVRAVVRARIPFARASASMIWLLEATIPVEATDRTVTRFDERATTGTSVWDDVAWGELPAGCVVLVTDPRLTRQSLASAARGAIRADVTLVPVGVARRTLSIGDTDPALLPLRRDLELSGAPGEAALSSLAAARPVEMTYEPRWGRAVARHLVPAAIFDRFEPEPRGTSDRVRALDASAADRERLARAIVGDPREPREPELADLAASLLRARAASVVAEGDPNKDLAARTLADAHAFEPSIPLVR